MSPSINARWSEAESSLDFVAFRAVPTTSYPRARNARTIPAPMPCDAPVTITVLDGLFIVTLVEASLNRAVLAAVAHAIGFSLHDHSATSRKQGRCLFFPRGPI